MLAVALLAGCHASDRGPAWPKRADRTADGGESLSPHQNHAVASATGDDDAVVEDKPASEKPSAPTASTVDAPAKPLTPTADESLFGDDITIEIDD